MPVLCDLKEIQGQGSSRCMTSIMIRIFQLSNQQQRCVRAISIDSRACVVRQVYPSDAKMFYRLKILCNTNNKASQLRHEAAQSGVLVVIHSRSICKCTCISCGDECYLPDKRDCNIKYIISGAFFSPFLH